MSEIKDVLQNASIRGTLMHSDDFADAMAYCYNDVNTCLKFSSDGFEFYKVKPMSDLSIKKVIFNDPATIVYWGNGERTIIKCNEDDSFDQEKGLAMAICKRALGADYKKVFKEWIPEEEEEEVVTMTVDEMLEKLKHGFENLSFNFKTNDGHPIAIGKIDE